MAADGSESAAAASAATATTQASNAATSASNAATSATSASGSATAAGTSATNAATSESNASTSAAAAALAYDNFDDRYLGSKASDPALDNDGNALLDGALYYKNTATKGMRVYDIGTTSWQAAFVPSSGYATLTGTETLDNKTLTAPVINSPTGITATDIANTAAGNIAATTVQAALNELDSEKQAVSAKDATGGYAGLTLFKLNLRNAANTITSFFTNAATVARTWTMPDKDGTVAMTSDITGTNSGTNTGDETTATIKTKLGITTLSGSNTGDQTTIVGITGTLSEFNAALTGADFATGGGTATGTNTGDQTTVTGNAGSATVLQTARNIDGVSFNGSADITVIAPATHAATSKGTPIGADEIPLVDTAASNILKKLTLTNLAAFVFSVFGPLIAAATGKTTPVDADGVMITDSAASGVGKFLSFTNLKAFLLAYFNTKGLVGVESISLTSSVTTVLADAGKSFDHPASDANARTVTIDSNANVAYPVGTVLCFSNMTSQAVTIAITSDTLSWIGTGTTGSRTLAQYGQATARKIASTTWQIGGVNLT